MIPENIQGHLLLVFSAHQASQQYHLQAAE
jgi:hypothetical protein